MANKTLFSSTRGALLPAADALNREGVGAYEYVPKHKLAQYAATGCLSNTFYANGQEQLATVLGLIPKLDVGFVAKCAVYARQNGMKDVPTLLLASLSVTSTRHMAEVFGRVVDNGRMLRNFVQILRSGTVGRKSLGSAPKALVARWLNEVSERKLIEASVGTEPSLQDIVRMVHPKPKDTTREAFYGWLLGKPFETDRLPSALQSFIRYPSDRSVVVCPDVSGSMHSAVTEARRGTTSIVQCIDVAALMAAAVVRMNKQAIVLPFEQCVREVDLNARDSVVTNAKKLASMGGGGTDCSAPLEWLKARNLCPDLVIMVSDNQSWVDARPSGPTQMMRQWEWIKGRNREAKLVCIDLQANGTTQAAERRDVLNVGGFSDEVFEVVARFARGELGAGNWVDRIEAVEL
ncbi:MAG TPA: hypothetical protein VNO35_13435 [Steroidobacteraceae bacterium]|nr:hypothetical protein [Steroidobacteraceae bacterium]